MMTSSFRKQLMRGGPVCALVACLGMIPSASADDHLAETLQRNEKDQQQVQSQARELAAQLRAVSSEFERNGLTGDSVKMLDVLSAALSTMSEQEMTRITGLLRQARTLNDKTAVLQQVAAAYADQKKLTVDMKGLLARYQKDQVTADVAATLAKLAERQSVNFQTGVDVAQWTETRRTNDNSQEALKAAVEMQSAEQAALRDEAKMATDRLQNAARDQSDPAAAARVQAALDKLKAVDATLDQAAQDLKDNHLFKAVGTEKTARDALRQLARELTPIKPSDADSLRQALHDVDDMVAQQKEMLAATARANQTPPDFEKWLQQGLGDPQSEAHKKLAQAKLLDKTLDELKTEKKAKDQYDQQVRASTQQSNQQLGALEAKANDLVNKADDVGQNLQPGASDPAATVKAAQEKLRAARADLDDRAAAPALQDQQGALAQLQQAQKQIQAKLAAEDAGANADRTASLQAIKQQGKELAAQQNAASQQQTLQPQAPGHAAQQSDLKKKAQDLQDKAAQSQSPAAAAAFQGAAEQMAKASAALGTPSSQPQAQAAQNAAQAELAKAEAALDKDLAQAAAEQQQLQQAEQALAALEKVITGEEKLQADATGLAAKEAKPPRAANTAALAGRQAMLEGSTAAILPLLDAPELKPAATPLNAAQDQMEAARGALARSDASAALEPVRTAMTDLLQAKALLNAGKDALQQQTNPQTAEQQAQQAAQDAAQQIAQAQQQAQQAQEQLAQSGQQAASQPASAQQALNNAANLAGQAAAPAAAFPAMKQNLQDAQQALSQAAAAAAQGNTAAAQAQTQQAQNSLAQAQAQAAQAQAGLAQASPAQSGSQPAPGPPSAAGKPSGPPGPPGPPGQQPGQGPGTGESPEGKGDRDVSNIGQGKIVQGSGAPAKKGGAFSRLPARDRAALQQSQSEKYPQEYGQMIEQYMQNLADQPGS